MDPREQREAEDQLAIYELVLAALERRHEVVDVVWDSTDKDQAAERLRELLGDGVDPVVVLDLQIGKHAIEERQKLAAIVTHLRQLLGRGKARS